jgi:tRNA threonylcarbamoyladenosine biosynthesis protein TsaE
LIRIKDLNDLPQAAEALLDRLAGRRVVAFYGAMGAGKTTLIRAMCEQLGVQDNVSSPTFSIVNEYRTPGGERIFHFDFYRIEQPAEVFDLGYEEYFYSGDRCLVEWPEKIEGLLPEETARVFIESDGDGSRRLDVRL